MADLDAELDAFAQTEAGRESRGGGRCWLCSIPERALIERGREMGKAYAWLARLLRSKYPERLIGIHQITNHFQAGHRGR
jgi:hypothetical protein